MVVLDHPEVVSFYRDHDLNVRDAPIWELEWLGGAEWDGDEVQITVPLEGDELVVRVDDSLTVTAAQRA